MMRMKLNLLLLFGVGGAFIWGLFFGIQLYSAFGAKQNIYWTAQTLPLQINETKDSFELSIVGKSIHDHLLDKTLLVQSADNVIRISPANIQVRLNNWYRVKSSFLTHALWSGMVFSACLTLFLVGLFQGLIPKNIDRRQGAEGDAVNRTP